MNSQISVETRIVALSTCTCRFDNKLAEQESRNQSQEAVLKNADLSQPNKVEMMTMITMMIIPW